MASIPAIPTTYNGVRFRSRLEARYAAFFDDLELEWAYEPLELSGWIPDFSLVSMSGRYELVEIKPAHTLRELSEFFTKIEQSGTREQVVLYGLNPLIFWLGKYRGTAYDGDRPIPVWHWDDDYVNRNYPPELREIALNSWKKAGNATQWRGDLAQP